MAPNEFERDADGAKLSVDQKGPGRTVLQGPVIAGAAMELHEKLTQDLSATPFAACIGEVAQILTEWTGSERNAYQWYVTHPIASLGSKTAEQIVRERDFPVLMEHLKQVGFAGERRGGSSSR